MMNSAEWDSDSDDYLPLHIAVRTNNPTRVESLLLSGIDSSRKDIRGLTPLHQSTLDGSTKCLYVLLQNGVDVSIPDAYGNTAIILATERLDSFEVYGRYWNVRAVRTIEKLLKYGADIEERSMNGMTPLHIAAMHGHTGAVQLLIDKGACLYALDPVGKMPEELATDAGLPVLAALIKRERGCQTHLAFAMGQHERLGNNSAVRMISEEEMGIILGMLSDN
jgi:ankyrin repeat protein